MIDPRVGERWLMVGMSIGIFGSWPGPGSEMRLLAAVPIFVVDSRSSAG